MTIRRRHTLVIRRDDHKHDALGAIFLGSVANAPAAADYVGRYLNRALRTISIKLDDDTLRVVVESTAFEEESQNLVKLGRGLLQQGRPRSAADMFGESLRLDPLNVEALKRLAALGAQRGGDERASELWVRAGEIAGFDGEILLGLAMVALHEGRTPSARRYLEEALLVNPEDRESRRVLDEINRQTELGFCDRGEES